MDDFGEPHRDSDGETMNKIYCLSILVSVLLEMAVVDVQAQDAVGRPLDLTPHAANTGSTVLLLTTPTITSAGNPAAKRHVQQGPVNIGPQAGHPISVVDVGAEAGHQIDDLANSHWFALAAGFASILGLLLTLYTTQVSALPTSLYRSLVARQVLAQSISGGTLVWSSVQFYNQSPPGIVPLQKLYYLLHGVVIVEPIEAASGTTLWAALFLLSVALFGLATLYRPLRIVRDAALAEQRTLSDARSAALVQLFGNSQYDQLSEIKRRQYDDVVSFYVELQRRIVDVLMGPSSTVTLYQPWFSHNPYGGMQPNPPLQPSAPDGGERRG